MSPKGQPNAEEECPKKEELGRRGSEFTGEGVVTAHWEKEKLAGCPLQSRATALGQAGTASEEAASWGVGAGVQRALGLCCWCKAQIT